MRRSTERVLRIGDRPLRQIRIGLERREERQVPYAVSGVRPAPDQLKDRPNLRFGKLVHQVMQFLTPRAAGGDLNQSQSPVQWIGALMTALTVIVVDDHTVVAAAYSRSWRCFPTSPRSAKPRMVPRR
jgi:hypothetical protein